MKAEIGDPLLVTTSYRGVFFGYFHSENLADNIITLTRARNCIYWPPETRGFIGLATSGPLDGSRVGPACDTLELRTVTAVARVQPDAVTRWEDAPWRR